MIGCRDFAPRQLTPLVPPGALFAWVSLMNMQGEYESFDSALAAANAWIGEERIEVINVETVVLPNIWQPSEEGTRDAGLRTGDLAVWHQFVRVWYRTDRAADG